MAKKKYYVVWEGHQQGIFDDWKSCEAAVKNYDGAKYKSFESLEEAQKASQQPFYKYIGKNAKPQPKTGATGSPIKDSIAVDAAWNTVSKVMEYQGVYTATGDNLFHQGPFPDGTNNVGEFLAIVHALAYCKKHKVQLPIYTDSMTAMAWIRNKKAKTTLEPTSRNGDLFDMIDRAEQWLRANTWSNKILKWDTEHWGEIPADFGRK